MRIILIILSCLCLQTEGYAALIQEVGVIARSSLKRLNSTSFRSFSTFNTDFSSMVTEKQKTPQFNFNFPETQNNFLQGYRNEFNQLRQQIPLDNPTEIRKRHEAIINIEYGIITYLALQDPEDNILKRKFEAFFTQLALAS
jgi:hypothetical protein